MTKFIKCFRWHDAITFLVCLALIVMGVWLDLLLPDYMNEIITLTQTPGTKMSDIYAASGKMLLCALGSVTTTIFICIIIARVSAIFSRTVRQRIFNHINDLSLAEINNFSTASLLTRTTNDVTQVQMFFTFGAQFLFKAPILAIWAVLKIRNMAVIWSISTGITVAALALMVTFVVIYVVPKFTKMQKLTDNLTKLSREHLTGLRVIRAYNAEDYQANKFADANQQIKKTQLQTTQSFAFMAPFFSFITNLLGLSIYWFGAELISNAVGMERISIFGDMVVFISYAFQIIMAFLMLVMTFFFLPRAVISARRINQVLNAKSSIEDGTVTSYDPAHAGEIIFENVSFSYPNAASPVLEDISFTIKKGQTVAFIGSTGSGKSTLVNLIARFYDATSGKITVSGVDVRDYQLDALYAQLSYVSQRAVLFQGTIEANLALGTGSTIDQARIDAALETAQASEFVNQLDEKSLAPVSQQGSNFSGGQKQRLAMARACYRQPSIYIFDDSFSALDYQTDRKLRQALKTYTSESTCVIVAQRIGTIIDSDCIIVLDEGRIVGIGKHQELLKTCTVYQEIALSQLNQEELNHGA